MCKSHWKMHVMKINSQSDNEDIMMLLRELLAIAASISTTLGDGLHGHVEMLLDDAKYQAFLNGGAVFRAPTNPAAYPTTVDQNNAVVRAWQVAKHKQQMIEFETYLCISQTLWNKIEQAIDLELLEAIWSPTLAFTTLTQKEMIKHLQSNKVELDDNDISELVKKLYAPWDINENPATKFARNNKIESNYSRRTLQHNHPSVSLSRNLHS